LKLLSCITQQVKGVKDMNYDDEFSDYCLPDTVLFHYMEHLERDPPPTLSAQERVYHDVERHSARRIASFDNSAEGDFLSVLSDTALSQHMDQVENNPLLPRGMHRQGQQEYSKEGNDSSEMLRATVSQDRSTSFSLSAEEIILPSATGDDSSCQSTPPGPISLTQLVKEDSKCMAPEQDEELERRISSMVYMRRNLELFVDQKTASIGLRTNGNLFRKINHWANACHLNHEFVQAMHRIRDYGNRAAHSNTDLPNRDELEFAVQRYRELKDRYR
jgi:hypothetical protein